MARPGAKSGGRRAPKNGGIGSAVLHHCLRQQAEATQKHHAFIQSLKEQGGGKTTTAVRPPAAVALGGTISRHRTLEFLSGALTSANPAKGSTQSKHSEQHLRSVIERNGLDEYLCTALAAQENFAVDKYEARLLHEPTAVSFVSETPTVVKRGRGDCSAAEGGDVIIPRRPIVFSRSTAQACRTEDPSRSAEWKKQFARNRRRRNRARVKLLLAGKMEEATIHNVQFVRQQRDELHARYQKDRGDAKIRSKQGHAVGGVHRGSQGKAGGAVCGAAAAASDESDGDVDAASQSAGTEDEGREALSEEAESVSSNATSGDALSSYSVSSAEASDADASASEAEHGTNALGAPSPVPSRLPRTADELDNLEMDSFLHWRRALASMEDKGIVLTPYERNLEVWRQLWRVVERSHLVLQIVDGRSPAFFRCKDLEKYIKEVSPDKEFLVVVNKSDLLPPAVRAEWARYFEGNGVEAVFFSALRELHQQAQDEEQEGFSDALEEKGCDRSKREDTEAHEEGFACSGWPSRAQAATGVGSGYLNDGLLTCDALVDLLVKRREAFLSRRRLKEGEEGGGGLSDEFVVGTVGYPNVGKSSLINAVLKVKKVSVSQQPGKTRRLQTIPLKGRGITLCDCPGLVFPKAVTSKHMLVLNGVVPVDEMRGDYLPSVQLVCDAIPHTLLQHYGITVDAYRAAQKAAAFTGAPSSEPRRGDQREDSLERLEASVVLLVVAAQRRFVSGGKGGQLDLYRVASMILRDFTTGRLLRCHMPGGRVFGDEDEAAKAAQFLASVRTPIEARLAEDKRAASRAAVGPPTVGTTRMGAPARIRAPQQMNPLDVLQELEEDTDLLEVLQSEEAAKATGRPALLAMTKRKARQMQKQLQKGNASNVTGVAYRR
ncbi:large subunit GTPase 1 [Cyclospora cayetanensis]|nr:large subunit GTPase 1 [Cyclospora cayetanensis]